MSLAKFFQTIDDSFIGKFINKRVDVLEQTNPERIYVENIRRFYNMPHKAAKFFCDMAVHQHLFNKKYGVKCPQCEKNLLSVDYTIEIPDTLHCDNCELEERELFDFPKQSCQVVEFYQLNKSHG